MGALLSRTEGRALAARHGEGPLTAVLRELLEAARKGLGRGEPAPGPEDLLAEAAGRLAARAAETLHGVINATGVVIHTNLGRAPLAPEAVAAMTAAAGYGTLEFDLESGRRASRHHHLDRLIAEVTGAEAGIAVNNGAGAVLLVLAALAAGTPVIVSRGELIEIGGGFRVPDIVQQSGARLVEVGTTNRTHLKDYAAALKAHPETKVILRTHPSNFRISGFTGAPSLRDLAAFARDNGLLLIEDLGGGALIDLSPYGVSGEPRVQDSLAGGADLVIFSGDKLLGGPQAGLIAGRRDLVDRASAHPLARALRLDKLCVAALAATLRLYRPPLDPAGRIPVLAMLTAGTDVLQGRAEALQAALAGTPGLACEVVETLTYAGGGAMPMHALPGRALRLASAAHSADALARSLRTGAVKVVGRIEDDHVLLEMRTVPDTALEPLAAAVRLAST